MKSVSTIPTPAIVEIPTRDDWPEYLDGYEYRPAYHLSHAGPQRRPPPGIIIHSGAIGANTAHWATRDDVGNENRYFPHFAWCPQKKDFVQVCSMRLRAPHAGDYNDCIGIEIPGPWNKKRTGNVRLALHALNVAIVERNPTIRYITGHEFINREKRDPGSKFVTADWFSDLGLNVHWVWVGDTLVNSR